MTITVSEDCMTVTLDSTYLAVDNQQVELTVIKNCSTEYEVAIDVTEEEIIINNERLGLAADEPIEDGVYNFRLKITQNEGATVEESICKFINCGSDCLMVSVFNNIGKDEDCTAKAMAYYALKLADQCSGCSCADLCTLYAATGLIPSVDVNGCGCS